MGNGKLFDQNARVKTASKASRAAGSSKKGDGADKKGKGKEVLPAATTQAATQTLDSKGQSEMKDTSVVKPSMKPKKSRRAKQEGKQANDRPDMQVDHGKKKKSRKQKERQPQPSSSVPLVNLA